MLAVSRQDHTRVRTGEEGNEIRVAPTTWANLTLPTPGVALVGRGGEQVDNQCVTEVKKNCANSRKENQNANEAQKTTAVTATDTAGILERTAALAEYFP